MWVNKLKPRAFINQIQRFYTKSHHEIIGDPKQQLFTMFLEKTTHSKTNQITSQKNQPNEHFKVSKAQYLQFADQDPYGSVIEINHKELDLTLLSTSFSSMDSAGLYKSIQKIKPDLILVQIRPDSLLHDFNPLPKRNSVFSDRSYFKQILRSPFEVMPSAAMRQQVMNRLKGRVTLKEIHPSYQQQYGKKLKQSQSFSKFISRQNINNYVIGTSAYYCQRNNIQMVLCGLPEISERQILANSYSLMELQIIFKKSCQQLAVYSKVTPKKIANFIYPQVFMNPADQYISTLIEYIVAKKKYKNVLVLTGVMENKAIAEYLRNRKVGKILECIFPPKPEGSILKQIQNFQVIQKHCLFDMMEFGEQILKTPMELLNTTNILSRYYADPHCISKQQVQKIMKFRIDMYKKYLGVMSDSKLIGQQLKTKDFIRRAIQF